MQWLKTFGDDFYNCQKINVEISNLRNMLSVKEANPEMSLDEVKATVEQQNAEHKKELLQLEIDIEQVQSKPTDTFVKISQENYRYFTKETKKLLREIWRLTHTDVVSLEEFSPKEKKLLE